MSYKLLDSNGLSMLWSKIKASFGTAIVKNSSYSNYRDDDGRINIPFVANHQIVEMNMSSNINVFNWLKGASEGGILEIVFAGAQGGYTYCTYQGTSLIYQMTVGQHGPQLNVLQYLSTSYNTYTRLIKSNGRIIVAEFVQNN